jgi:hypothetical protein
MPWTYCLTRSRTDEPSAHPWHQISIDSCIMGSHFQANAGIQEELGPGVRRDDGNVPFGENLGEMLYIYCQHFGPLLSIIGRVPLLVCPIVFPAHSLLGKPAVAPVTWKSLTSCTFS